MASEALLNKNHSNLNKTLQGFKNLLDWLLLLFRYPSPKLRTCCFFAKQPSPNNIARTNTGRRRLWAKLQLMSKKGWFDSINLTHQTPKHHFTSSPKVHSERSKSTTAFRPLPGASLSARHIPAEHFRQLWLAESIHGHQKTRPVSLIHPSIPAIRHRNPSQACEVTSHE